MDDPTKNPNHEVREKQRMSTARVLSAIKFYHHVADEQAKASLDNMRQAEEGRMFGNCSRTASMLDITDGSGRRANPGVALSMVASMSDMQSSIQQVHSPSEEGLSPGKHAYAPTSDSHDR